MRKTTLIWLLLVALSIASALMGDFNELNAELVIAVLVMLSLKGQLIVDHFMELRDVKWHWRIVLSAFCPLLSATIYFSWRWVA